MDLSYNRIQNDGGGGGGGGDDHDDDDDDDVGEFNSLCAVESGASCSLGSISWTIISFEFCTLLVTRLISFANQME
jgi:hypothetical protein